MAFVHWRTAWTRSLLARRDVTLAIIRWIAKYVFIFWEVLRGGEATLMIWLQWATSDITHWIFLKIRLNYLSSACSKDVFARMGTMQILGKRKATVPWEMMIEKSSYVETWCFFGYLASITFKNVCNIATPCHVNSWHSLQLHSQDSQLYMLRNSCHTSDLAWIIHGL